MKNLYFVLSFFFFNFFVSAQTSSEVGITEGQLSVSLSGAATYTIPIAVPPGINGVVPQISLAYNSQGGNGVAGFGWNISGISAITRIPSTKYHDNAIDPVDFNALDRFALDGQRLIVKNGAVYETENFSNVKITSYGVHPNGSNYGPAYFIVEYPDGSKAYYGNSADSRSITDWAITYWENPQGVRINYTYSSSNNILEIASIKYGGTASTASINEIKFNYVARKRVEQSFIGGVTTIRSRILKEINVLGSGVGFRNYVLEQEETSLGYQRLKTLTEKSGDNTKSYNPTKFNYDTTISDVPLKVGVPAPLGISGINYSNSDYISGDFNDDGKTDIILYSKIAGLNNKYTLFSNIKAGSNNSGAVDNVGTFEKIFPASFLSSNSKLLPQGWTILKRTDTKCILSVHGVGSTTPTFKHYEKEYNFSKTVTKASNWSYCDPKDYTGVIVENIPMEYISGDFNGDGLTDVIAVEKSFYYDMRVCNFGNHTTEYQRPLYQGGKAYLFNLDRRITSNEPESIGSVVINNIANSKLFVADFDGDGKSDIYVLEPNFIKVYKLDKDNKLVLLYQNTSSDTSIVLDRPILFGDYNGDGKIDFVIPNAVGQDSWNFYLATGTNFNKINSGIGLTYELANFGTYAELDPQGVTRYPYCLNEKNYIANDYNGDGKTDILFTQNLTVAQSSNYKAEGEPVYSRLTLFENKSVTNTAVVFSMLNTAIQTTGIKRDPIPVFTNHNQINRNLEFSLINDNAILTFNSPKDNRIDVLVKDITNGNGVKETITYKNLQQDPYEPIYTPTALNETFPNIDIIVIPGFKIVTMLEKQSVDVYKKQLYFYSGAVSNTEGLGFLGFRSTSKTNWHGNNDSDIISTLSKNDISLRGANVENYTVLGLHTPLQPNPNAAIISSTIVKDNYTVSGSENLVATQSITLKPDSWIKSGSTFSAKINEDANTGTSVNTPADFITKSLFFYDSELSSNKVFKIKNSKTKQFNGLDNTSSETSIEYDADYNPSKSTTLLKESGGTVQTTVSTISYNPPTASPYVAGRPSGKNQSITISGDVMTSEELYFYQNNLLTQVKKKGTNTDYIVEDNVYDAFGNITQKTITASGLPARVTSYEYDSSGRFLTRSTDIESLSTSYVYNIDGTLKSETNPYGLTTSYLYDSWFKKTTTTDYLGKKNSYTYTRSSTKTIITSTADDGSVNEETFDDLGRKIRVGSKNIMGTFAYVDYQYDIQDRNNKVSEPYFGSSGTQWNETKYDVYGRVIQNISFTGKITDITYSGLTTTVSDGTKSKTSVKNAMGNVVSMTDTPSGNIKYTYFANGNLKESEYAGVKTTILQDGWGRKTKLVDASAGTYTYTYNAFGETTSETTPNGTTAYVLNAVGKVTQKTINGTNTNSKTTYEYDSLSKLLTGSKFEDLSNGSNTILNSFTYDDSKRISTSVETTPYAVFTKEFKYDDFGRINTETSTAATGGKSSSKTIKNTYKNGSHWQILDNTNNAVLWQTSIVNARGQLKEAQNGPITITNLYDIYSLASQFKYDKTSGSSNILTLNTVFDAKRGNLTSRTNSLFNRNESFKYDAQDRLTEFTNAQGAQEKQLYDDQGRITQNNLGTYSYAITGKPYQNSSITVSPEALSYYTAKPLQNIAYNSFKSPVQIDEKDIDKISFAYNDDDSRTAMFYGGLQNDKLQRPLRKYYSADGSMEIKENRTTNTFEFITYIGGDGYSAPIVLRSNGNGTAQDYLYLQRDYQGSIVAITDANGAILEKRLFDAWGAIVSVQDGAGNNLAGLTILDRGYTGHEHLQSVGLINMNGRIYDPKLHRFLQPDNFVQDPFNTQNYNRYGYVLNNPLKYIDPSGEFAWAPVLVGAIIGAIIGGTSYVAKALVTGNWNWGQFGGSILGGAIIGGITGGVNPSSLLGSSVGGAVATGYVAAVLPSYGVQVGEWSFNISPSIAFGNTTGIGASISATYDAGDFSFSGGVGIMSNSNYNGFGKNGLEIRKSILAAYDDGKSGVSLGSNIWGGDFKQQTGTLGLHFGDFRALYENDGKPFSGIFGDGNDQYRSAALSLSVGKYSAGFNLFTGARTKDDYEIEKGLPGGELGYGSKGRYGEYYKNGFVNETGTKYRMGAAYFGFKDYKIGTNSEWIRHAIQNVAIHGTFIANQRMFEMQSGNWGGYFQYKNSNIFTTW